MTESKARATLDSGIRDLQSGATNRGITEDIAARETDQEPGLGSPTWGEGWERHLGTGKGSVPSMYGRTSADPSVPGPLRQALSDFSVESTL